jgi:hypothetical protein
MGSAGPGLKQKTALDFPPGATEGWHYVLNG